MDNELFTLYALIERNGKMSNRLFQGVMQRTKETLGRTVGVIDDNGIVIACSTPSVIGETRTGVKEELAYSGAVAVIGGYTYRFIADGMSSGYAVFVEGADERAETSTGVLAITLGGIKELYDEKYDKASFIKNIMLDNILPGDIFVKSKELHFSSEEHRVVLIIRFGAKTDMLPYDIIEGMFPDKAHDYVININEQEIVLVKEITPAYEIEEAEELAASIVETLNTEFYAKASVGISTIAESLKDLARAYKEARIALEVGKVFDTEKNVISYDNLGIGRLIYQLPTTLCEIFLQEVFKKGSLESLDRETLMTVQAFFENNLNVSETSRKLFVHRNTLVYRLEKIRKITGLDLREFDQAVTFKVALMVKKYLTTRPTKF